LSGAGEATDFVKKGTFAEKIILYSKSRDCQIAIAASIYCAIGKRFKKIKNAFF
jgi:hypothetical protein